MVKRIALGSDHGGFVLKEKIAGYLKGKGYDVHDAGASSSEPCDYPLYGFKASGRVSSGKADRAVLVCRSGIGMALVANKVPGVRAGVCLNEKDAVSSRKHNDTNVLVLAADKTSPAKALKITRVWLRTEGAEGRHLRRIKQIKAREKKLFKNTKKNKTGENK